MLLIPLIPHRKIEHDTREQTTLCDTQEEPRGQEPSIILNNAHERRDDTPDERERWEP